MLAELRKEIVKDYDAILRTRLLDLISPSFVTLKLPEDELARQRELYLDEIEYYYDYYNYMYNLYYGQNAFASVEECALWYLGLEKGADWSAELDRVVEDAVRQNLMLYAIAENEGIEVSEQSFSEMLDQLATEFEMEAAELIELAGADLVYSELIYDAVTEILLSHATVNNGDLPLASE